MKWLYRSSLGIIFLFLVCVGSFLLNFVFTQLSLRNNYCSENNPVYQFINFSARDWIDSSSTIRTIEFRTDDNKLYIAEADWDTQVGAPPLIYVSVGTNLDSLSGAEGFLLLLPDKSIPRYWFENYWITYLDNNIYCYRIRGF